MLLQRWMAVSMLCLLQACAATAPPVEGPSATIVDTAMGGGRGGAAFFTLTEYDGKQVPDALGASLRASYGMGANLRIVSVERQVPAGKLKLKLAASYGYAAPIQQIFSSLPETAMGFVEVELQAGRRYRVNGVLDTLRSEVWLEESDTGQVVSTKLVAAPSAEAKRAAAADLAYTCCNLRYDRDGWISDANWLERPFVPAGSPIKLYEVRSDRSKAMVDGRPMWLGLDFARKQLTFQEYAARIALKEDPKPRIASYPVNVQAAIRDGRILVGMTKEQVTVSLGYPRLDKTASLDAPRWLYTTWQDEIYAVEFDAEQRVLRVDASPDVRSQVLVTGN